MTIMLLNLVVDSDLTDTYFNENLRDYHFR